MAKIPAEFSDYLEQLHSSWPHWSWEELLSADPSSVAIIVVDLVRGFTQIGPLSGPRVDRLVEPTAQFLTQAHQRGVRQFFFGCDCHPADSPEFQCFPPHCQQGTPESELDPRLQALPFANQFQIVPKLSLSSFCDTDLLERLLANRGLRRLLFVGDCTDLCIYHGAMAAKMLVNCRKLPWEVAVHAGLVDTYDLPVEIAQQIGAVPHPGDFIHQFFLYHLHLNGVKVVGSIG